jgi:hypothetical protein
MNKSDLLTAMRADTIPVGWSGLWFVTKGTLRESTPCTRHGKPVVVPPGTYTYLYRVTDSTVYCDPPGEVVMEDTPFDANTSRLCDAGAWPGTVTGLGLGCVSAACWPARPSSM